MVYTYTLTFEERRAAIERLTRKASPLRLWIQAILLGIVAIGTVVGMFLSHRAPTLLEILLPIICVALIPAQWLVPRWYFSTRAKEEVADLAAQGREEIQLEILPGALRFGLEEEGVLVPDEEWADSKVYAEMLLVKLSRGAVAIPKRVVGDDMWLELMTRNEEG